MIKLAPSILSADFARLLEDVKKVEKAGCEYLHIDVMDGHFVPNITFGASILKGFKESSSLYLDVHLMISDPVKYLSDFKKAGANQITVHVESFSNDIKKIEEAIRLIHELGCDAGITCRPNTQIEPFECLLDCIETFLVMSVEPGFGGQTFMENQLEKVRWLKQKREEKGLSYRIEIDGGINSETAKKSKEAGCDTLVAGSYIFKNDIEETIRELLK